MINRYTFPTEIFRQIDQLLPQIQQEPQVQTQVNKHDTGWTLQFQLPGVEKDRLSLKVEENLLKLAVTEDESTQGFVPAFEKSWKLGSQADTATISAELKNGVLTVEVPKLVVTEESTEITIS